MAPIQSDDESIDTENSVSDSEAETPMNGATGTNGILEEGEEEFHTEDSEDSEDDADQSAQVEEDETAGDHVSETAPGIAPLPEHLLKPQAQPVQPAQSLADMPWDRLTAKQKKARRNNGRRMKKRTWDRLRAETKGTGVLEAGKVAQAKRGVLSTGDKVRSGRVEKKAREGLAKSGRQQLLEERKRTVQRVRAGMGGVGGGGKGKTKAKSKR